MFKYAIALIALCSASACNNQPQDECWNAKDPQECRQYVNAGGDSNNYLLYGMAGYMLGRMGNGQTYLQPAPGYSGYRPPVRHDYYNKYRSTPAFRTAKVTYRPKSSFVAVTKTTTYRYSKPASTGVVKSYKWTPSKTTYTTRYSSSPSRSYSYSSPSRSFSSGRR